MLTLFRHLAVAAVAMGALTASAAVAQRAPEQHVARLDPGYGGVCEECDLSGRILAGARLRNSNFNGSDFSRAVLARADARGSRFERVDFTGADLRDANASGANFSGATFDGADLSDANLSRARFSGADLRAARGLTQTQLDEACGDPRTRLPRGMRMARC